MIKKYLWMIPFLCFASGYYFARTFFFIAQFEAPSVIGKSLDEALTLLSNHHFSVKLLSHRSESTLSPGIILDQIPAADQMVKARQTVFITVSQVPEWPIIPSFIGKSLSQIEQEARQQSLKIKTHHLESSYPQNSCIGQTPSPGCALTEKHLIVYLAKESPKAVIWPDFRNKPLSQACAALELHGITAEISGHSQQADPLVLDQRPLPGSISFFDTKKTQKVQLSL